MTTTTKQRKRDLSHIDTLSDLQREVKLVKARLNQHEYTLNEQWKKLPAESFKVVVRKVVPFYLNNKVLDKSWGLISGIFGLLGAGNKTDAVKNVTGTAKKLGVFTVMRAAYNLWKRKK